MDVLLFGLDDVSLSDVTADTCPRITAFRATAIDFQQAYSHPVCSQSRAGILYGAFGKALGTISDLGAFDYDLVRPPASWPTLASVLGGAGYTTALVGKWHCGAPMNGSAWELGPWERGYDSWLAGSPLNLDSYTGWLRTDATGSNFTTIPNYILYATAEQRGAALDWLTETTGPRFLHVALSAPHGPLHLIPAAYQYLLAGMTPPISGATAREKYLAMLRTADTVFGDILDEVGPDAIVCVYSDNGTAPGSVGAGQNPARVKGTTLIGGTRVLLAARLPGVPPGTASGFQHLVDIPAGILAVAGIAKPAEWGSSSVPRSSVLCEAQFADGHKDRCVRTATWMLRQITAAGQSTPTEEAYNRVSDPLEATPLAPVAMPPAVLTAMRAALEAAALPPGT